MSRAHDTAQSAVMQGMAGRGGRVTRIIGLGHISSSSQQGCVVAACVSEQRAEAGVMFTIGQQTSVRLYCARPGAAVALVPRPAASAECGVSVVPRRPDCQHVQWTV